MLQDDVCALLPDGTPGSAFGTPGYARLSYAASEGRLREAVERLADNDYI